MYGIRHNVPKVGEPQCPPILGLPLELVGMIRKELKVEPNPVDLVAVASSCKAFSNISGDSLKLDIEGQLMLLFRRERDFEGRKIYCPNCRAHKEREHLCTSLACRLTPALQGSAKRHFGDYICLLSRKLYESPNHTCFQRALERSTYTAWGACRDFPWRQQNVIKLIVGGMYMCTTHTFSGPRDAWEVLIQHTPYWICKHHDLRDTEQVRVKGSCREQMEGFHGVMGKCPTCSTEFVHQVEYVDAWEVKVTVHAFHNFGTCTPRGRLLLELNLRDEPLCLAEKMKYTTSLPTLAEWEDVSRWEERKREEERRRLRREKMKGLVSRRQRAKLLRLARRGI